jgi:hypothetical protein
MGQSIHLPGVTRLTCSVARSLIVSDVRFSRRETHGANISRRIGCSGCGSILSEVQANVRVALHTSAFTVPAVA